jgi:hypothetical protein
MTYVPADRKVFTERGLIIDRNCGTKKTVWLKKYPCYCGGQMVDKQKMVDNRWTKQKMAFNRIAENP